MAFEYNGVIHRDLEPQVRYDAEQIQLLKQADVTINENLQTINTEVNGKLTKPTNPSAESAVTMLANGTVGTKPLSEIGGGKLYMHRIKLISQAAGSEKYDYYFDVYTLSIDDIPVSALNFSYLYAVCYSQSDGGVYVGYIDVHPHSSNLGCEFFGVKCREYGDAASAFVARYASFTVDNTNYIMQQYVTQL